MTGVEPQIPPSPGPANEEAIRKIENYRVGELERVQTRGEKWLAALTAVVGLLSSAIVVKGKDTFAKLDPEYEVFGLASPNPVWIAATGILLGYACYVVGILKGYSAAFGNPFSSSQLDKLIADVQADPNSAARTLRTEVGSRVTTHQNDLKAAVYATVLGSAFVAAAVALTWFVPDKPPAAAEPVCVQVGGETVQFSGALPPVKSGEIRVLGCPAD